MVLNSGNLCLINYLILFDPTLPGQAPMFKHLNVLGWKKSLSVPSVKQFSKKNSKVFRDFLCLFVPNLQLKANIYSFGVLLIFTSWILVFILLLLKKPLEFWHVLLEAVEVRKVSNGWSAINFHYSGSHQARLVGPKFKTQVTQGVQNIQICIRTPCRHSIGKCFVCFFPYAL